MQDFIPVTPEETQARFDAGAKAAEISVERERRNFQYVLAHMPLHHLVELIRDHVQLTGLNQPKVADLLSECASRLEDLHD